MTERKKKDDKIHSEAVDDCADAEVGDGEAAAALDGPVAEAGADELSAMIAERDQYLDHLQRLKADFENYRKRVQRETESLRLRAAEGVVESLLPVIDNMQRALEAAESHEEGQLIQGVELVSGQMRAVLSSHGLEELPVEVGEPFDPMIHEAVVMQSSDELESGSVARVLEKGFQLHGRLLRPAKVIVVE